MSDSRTTSNTGTGGTGPLSRRRLAAAQKGTVRYTATCSHSGDPIWRYPSSGCYWTHETTGLSLCQPSPPAGLPGAAGPGETPISFGE